MNVSRLTSANAALVVVDLQERLVPAIHEHDRVISNSQLMLRAATVLDLPVFATTQYKKGLGSTCAAIAELLGAIEPIDKMSFSCFGSPEFSQALEASTRRTLILCGVEAHICVLQTGLDALARGYDVHVMTDAVSSRNPQNAELGRRRLEACGAVMSCTEMAIYEMLGVSGTPAFKAMLPSFK
ncbi:MAG: hydrolase [Vicinamibacteria bacterium]